jgi:hypothetical protein
MCQRAHATQAAKGVFRACVYACACTLYACMNARSRRTRSRSQAALPKSSLLVGGRIDADAVAHRSRAEQTTVDHTAFLPDQLLVACFQRVVVRRPKLPEEEEEEEKEEEDAEGGDGEEWGEEDVWEGWDENVEEGDDEEDGGYREQSSRNPLTREIYNLPWDRGANHLRALSATCIRWRDVAAPLLLALIDALRSDAEALVVDDRTGRDVRTKTCQDIYAKVKDGHRACLLAEGIKWGVIDRCESFRMCTGGPVFGIALGRALRSNPLGRLRSLYLGGPYGRDAGAGIADAGMVALCDALVGGALPVLKTLRLDGNGIGNPGAIALGAAASRVGVLEHCTSINLDNNHISDLGALCLALWMGGLPLVVDFGLYLEKDLVQEQVDQLVRSNSCGQRPFVGDLALVELMKALSDRLAKELRQAAMAPLTEGTPFPVRPCLARLEEAWQEDGPAVLELLAPWLALGGYEDQDESDITDSADMLADMQLSRLPFKGRSRAVWVVPSLKLLPSADMHGISAVILPDAPQLRSSTRGRGRKGRRGGRGGTHGRQGGTLQGHAD